MQAAVTRHRRGRLLKPRWHFGTHHGRAPADSYRVVVVADPTMRRKVKSQNYGGRMLDTQ